MKQQKNPKTKPNHLFTPADIKNFDYKKHLGNPGEYPFTRGIYPTMYSGKLWTMRMFSGFGTAEETNKRWKYLLEEGQTGLSTAFDFPTLMGYDSDHLMAYGEVGKCGVAIDSLRDFEILFDKIPLEKVSTSFTINPPAPVILAMYISIADQQGVDRKEIRGTIQNDMLKEFHAQNTLVLPPKPSIKIIVDIFEYGIKTIPKFNLISVSGYHIREAGSTAVQELAFTLSDGMAYVEAGINRGIKADEFAPQLSFFFNSQNDFFEELSKFRAARRIWAKVMKEKYGAKNPRSCMLRFHTQTAGCSLTVQQPENNIVRTTIQAMASIMGGTQSLHTNSYDEALALPSEDAVRIALRTQQIIAHESGVADTIDPLAGSYFVESLTNKMEIEAMKYIDKISEMGEGSMLDGVLKGIDNGFFVKEISNAAYEFQRSIDNKKRIIVGVNKYRSGEEVSPNLLKIDPNTQKIQVKRTKKVKKERDKKLVKNALDNLKCAAKNDENIMPFVLDAVKAYATVGEIMDVLRGVYGEYRDPGEI